MGESFAPDAKEVFDSYLSEYEQMLNFKDIVIAIGRSANERELSTNIYEMHHETLEAATAPNDWEVQPEK